MGQALDDPEAAIRNADLSRPLAMVAKLRELHAAEAVEASGKPALELVP